MICVSDCWIKQSWSVLASGWLRQSWSVSASCWIKQTLVLSARCWLGGGRVGARALGRCDRALSERSERQRAEELLNGHVGTIASQVAGVSKQYVDACMREQAKHIDERLRVREQAKPIDERLRVVAPPPPPAGGAPPRGGADATPT